MKAVIQILRRMKPRNQFRTQTTQQHITKIILKSIENQDTEKTKENVRLIRSNRNYSIKYSQQYNKRF